MSNTQSKPKFSGARMIAGGGLLYAFVGALGATVASLAVSYMAIDPAVTMNRTFLGLGFTIFIIVQGVSAPIIGITIGKKGARFSYILGSTISIIVGICLALFLGKSTLFYVLGIGLFMSYGCMCAGQIPTMTLLNTWFHRNRGRAISISLVMGAVITMLYPVITNAVIGAFNWRAAYWLIAIFAFIGLILAVFVVRNKPSDLGQEVDGGEVHQDAETAVDGAAKPAPVSRVYKATASTKAKDAIKTPKFWLIAVLSFTCYAGLNMTMAQAGLYFVSQGLTLSNVAVALSAQSLAAIIILLVLTGILDRVEPIRIHGLGTLLMAVGAIVAAVAGGSSFVMFFYYICVGVGYAIHTACMPAELANFFGPEEYSKIHGWLLPLVAILASFIPTIAGAVFDNLGTYVPFFYVLVVIGVIGFVCSCLVRVPKAKAVAESAEAEENVA